MAGLQPAINLNATLFQDNAPPPNNQDQALGAQVPEDPLAAALPAVAGPVPPVARAAEDVFQAPVRYRTFASLFADPASDPNHDKAFDIVTRFDPANAAPLTAAALKQALLGQITPYTYLCCASLNDTAPKIYVIHSLSRYPMSLAGQPTPWDNKIIGYLGDILGDTAMNVILTEEVFNEVPETLVLNAEALVQALPNLAANALLPRVRQNAADNAVQRRSRFLTYLIPLSKRGTYSSNNFKPMAVWRPCNPY
jgi:hypothetical protein